MRERMYGASTPRKRERRLATWLLDQGWSAAQVAEVLERDAHTIVDWLKELLQKGPSGLAFDQTGGPPRPRPGPTGYVEGGRASGPEWCGSGVGELELERSASLVLGI